MGSELNNTLTLTPDKTSEEIFINKLLIGIFGFEFWVMDKWTNEQNKTIRWNQIINYDWSELKLLNNKKLKTHNVKPHHIILIIPRL